MQVSKLKDFIERVGWTAIQAAAGAVLTVIVMDNIGWQEAASFVGIAALVAACKVITAQQFGDRGSGDAIPGGVEQ